MQSAEGGEKCLFCISGDVRLKAESATCRNKRRLTTSLLGWGGSTRGSVADCRRGVYELAAELR